MKPTLKLKKDNQILIQQVDLALSFTQRAKGLIGKDKIEENNSLFIKRCNLIHTFFMKFPIDCVFVDETLQIKGLRKNVQPWTFAGCLKATAVFELKAGQVEVLNLRIGDYLHVGH